MTVAKRPFRGARHTHTCGVSSLPLLRLRMYCITHVLARRSRRFSRAMSRMRCAVAMALVMLTHAAAVRASAYLDCQLRAVVYNRSRLLLPARGRLLDVWDALRLTTDCGMVPPPAGVASQPPAGDAPSPAEAALRAASAVFFADAVHGSDGNDGSAAAPFATVLRALRASRSVPPPTTVVLRDGTFYVPEALVLTAADSGLTITAIAGETPILSGGVPLPDLAWAPFDTTLRAFDGVNGVADCVTSPGASVGSCVYNGTRAAAADCAAACGAQPSCTSYTWFTPAAPRGFGSQCFLRHDGGWAPVAAPGVAVAGPHMNVWVADVGPVPGLTTADFNVLFGPDGRRAVRARFPNGNPETTFAPHGMLTAAGWLAPVPAPPPVEVTAASPSRNATESPFFTTFQTGVGGTLLGRFDPPASFWGTRDPPGQSAGVRGRQSV